MTVSISDPLQEARLRLANAIARPQSRHTYPLPSTPRFGAPEDLHATGGPASLYVHIPFCTVRCTYCFFVTQIGHGADDMQRYVDETLHELDLIGPALAHYRIESLYYGGGTPGLLPPAAFTRLHARLQPLLAPGATVTVETHPHAADAHRIRAWREAGVDRISMGVQTTDAHLLSLINRELTGPHVFPAIDRLLGAGFADINVDLLYGLPDQTPESWQSTLEALAATGVPSLSIYRTAFIPSTLAAFEQRGAERPTAEAARAMYQQAFEWLNAAGYHQPRYGASCFSRLDQPYGLNRHRRTMVEGWPMLGVGMGAYGTLAGYSYLNQRDRAAYQADLAAGRLPVLTAQPLPPEERPYKYAVEAWKQGFLCGEAYEARFGEPLEARFGPELAVLADEGQIVNVGREYRLTPEGARHPDAIAELFLSPTSRAHAAPGGHR